MPEIDASKPKLCVAGAAGRMGTKIIQEARRRGMATSGAVECAGHPQIGQSLSEMGISPQETRLVGPDRLVDAVTAADVYVSFTMPAAELANIPTVASLGKPIVLGTTGFTPEQKSQIIAAIQGKSPAIFTYNYSIGINIIFKLLETVPFKAFPNGYDFSINEIHHTGKKDAPSGTAKTLSELIAKARGYNTTVYGREGLSPRAPQELEVTALRAGGVPGIHDIIIAGPNEMIRIEHTAFSRDVFVDGAVTAAEWLSKQKEPKMYSMADVLGLN
ncbi:MAG: 4-hydroxy-tetrahydrodipicolinate reductase [Candidatus Bathyarchaeota archaeon]|nr:4-hydroxy-tetrahydrodipicolinate reductase [Candidatus Bathyarchaeota archaeon]